MPAAGAHWLADSQAVFHGPVSGSLACRFREAGEKQVRLDYGACRCCRQAPWQQDVFRLVLGGAGPYAPLSRWLWPPWGAGQEQDLLGLLGWDTAAAAAASADGKGDEKKQQQRHDYAARGGGGRLLDDVRLHDHLRQSAGSRGRSAECQGSDCRNGNRTHFRFLASDRRPDRPSSAPSGRSIESTWLRTPEPLPIRRGKLHGRAEQCQGMDIILPHLNEAGGISGWFLQFMAIFAIRDCAPLAVSPDCAPYHAQPIRHARTRGGTASRTGRQLSAGRLFRSGRS